MTLCASRRIAHARRSELFIQRAEKPVVKLWIVYRILASKNRLVVGAGREERNKPEQMPPLALRTMQISFLIRGHGDTGTIIADRRHHDARLDDMRYFRIATIR